MYIFILNGKDDGKSYDLTPGTHIIGRKDDADIVLKGDKYVSGTHAELTYAGQKITIADKNSKNGTFLLGEPVKNKVVVKPGDIVRIGRTFLKITRRIEGRYVEDEGTGERSPEAIVVVDIVGSSKIAQVMGDSVASKVKNLLNKSMKNNLELYPAEYIKSTGDGFMIIFTKVLFAVKFSIDLLKEISGDGSYKGFHIRIGIHYGETYKLDDDDRRGSAVDMAFRVESVKIGDMHQTVIGIKKEDLPRVDRIFISEAVQKLIASRSSIKTRCIGFFDLKGFNGRHRIFEVLN
ncbi:MAG TPA: FHA domain-containing protein [bacterium]|nr:FHA domain-containing protein [bacterium]